MNIEPLESFPDGVKALMNDYNAGIDQQDIMEVNMAVDGLLQSTFSLDEKTRESAGFALLKIALAQPKFLQKGLKILIHRYKGDDAEKSDFASITLGILVETGVRDFFEDDELLKKIDNELKERVSREKVEQEAKEDYLERIKKKEISLIGLSGEFLTTGTYYNRLILDEKDDEAYNTLQTLIDAVSKTFQDDKVEFLKGCTLLGRICNPEQREPFCENVVEYLYEKYQIGKKAEKESMKEIIIHILDDIQDLLPSDVALEFREESDAIREEIKKESIEKAERQQYLNRLSIVIPLLWENEVKEVAESYNEALQEDKEKNLRKIPDSLETLLLGRDERIRSSASLLLPQLILKNYDLIQDLTLKLINSIQKPIVAEALENSLVILYDKELLTKEMYDTLIEEKKQRDLEKKELKQEKIKELGRIDKIKVEFSADWDNMLIDLSEKMNDALLKDKHKDVEKIVSDTVKKYLYAEDKEISKQTILLLNNIAKKYPEMVLPVMGEMIELFNSKHERRKIAIDFLSLINKNPNRQLLFQDQDPELFDKIKEESVIRKKEIDDDLLKTKWDAIKLEVTTIAINTEWDKKLEKTARSYNEGIKAKDMEVVLKNVKIIVDMFLTEKNDDKLNQIIEAIGKIAKQNIELIAPSIEMFLEMVQGDDLDKKYRAIKGLGEVCMQRPGWAYKGIDALISMAANDRDDSSRMKALLEISIIGKANPTMLVEHIDTLINALSDINKHVRRLAALAIGSMAEAIPLEAQEALPALREALHDEYFLVRQFADKALKLIRQAMRK